MVSVADKTINIDIFLKITSDEKRNAYEIIAEHIKVIDNNPEKYTWWGNNQPFSPSKLEEFIEHGHSPKALIVIPNSSGGTGNIEFVADIIDSIKFDNKDIPNDKWRPLYYFDTPHKVFLKLSNFKKVDSNNYDIKDYFILSNDNPLIDKLHTQYACGYVYRNKHQSTSSIESIGDIQTIRGFLEGKRKVTQHITIERDARLIREAKSAFKKKYGCLYCEICELDFVEVYGELGEGFIEGHHKIPLAQLTKETEQIIDDIALLCSNCHSMIHRRKECLTVDELKVIVNHNHL